MAGINDCVPGRRVTVVRSGVARIKGKSGTIVEVSRIKRSAAAPLRDSVTVDIPGHGEVVVTPEDLEVLGD